MATYSEGIFLVFNGEAYGFLDKTGEQIAYFVYEHVMLYNKNCHPILKDFDI